MAHGLFLHGQFLGVFEFTRKTDSGTEQIKHRIDILINTSRGSLVYKVSIKHPSAFSKQEKGSDVSLPVTVGSYKDHVYYRYDE